MRAVGWRPTKLRRQVGDDDVVDVVKGFWFEARAKHQT
jgi:hypothetical protein